MLDAKQLRAFVQDGWTVLPRAVDRERIDAVVRRINHALGAGMDVAEAERRQVLTSTPELRSHDEVMALLFSSAAWPVAEALFAPRRLRRPTQAQIALRYPTVDGDHDGEAPLTPHIDGRPLGWNGVDEYRNFNLLVGVLLRDVTAPMTGNLAVWPGSHRQYAEWFVEHGTDGIALRAEMPSVALEEPVHVLGRAGDVVLAHYQLGHTVAEHYGPDIRYAVYFRLQVEERDRPDTARLTDPWGEWSQAVRAERL